MDSAAPGAVLLSSKIYTPLISTLLGRCEKNYTYLGQKSFGYGAMKLRRRTKISESTENCLNLPNNLTQYFSCVKK